MQMLLLGIYANVIQWLEQHMLRCPSKMLLHMDCPGCGLQRGIVALLKRNWAESFRIYPAALPILILFFYLLLHLLFKFKNGARILTILFMFCASIILVHYIYKVINQQL
ncbi:MAG: DUF2752 domain-containing protein [Chitinophagaceae bacterium]|nr:DUF2752 domain-containing protein [Chitinophagaceae bacterium]